MIESAASMLERLLVGASPAMRRVRDLVVRVARAKIPVLVQGPTGAGKELVARGLHLASGRSGAYVAFNVCAIGDAMLEDALFGHVKGAFTGATGDALGYLAEANGGTVFLDEINGLPLAAQAKLLRVLETGCFRPVGASRDRVSDFRVVAATNDVLAACVRRGAFREDLAFRLGGAVIDVPALRERIDDLPALVEHLCMAIGAGAPVIAPSGMRALAQHDWPGNVRELRHVLERLILLERSPIRAEDVARALGNTAREDAPVDAAAREQLLAILTRCEWNTAAAAALLSVNRTTVYRRMRRLGIRVPAPSAAAAATAPRYPLEMVR